jgi:hypothetical protein
MRPEVMPRVTGSKREMGWEVKMEEGRVRPGM